MPTQPLPVYRTRAAPTPGRVERLGRSLFSQSDRYDLRRFSGRMMFVGSERVVTLFEASNTIRMEITGPADRPQYRGGDVIEALELAAGAVTSELLPTGGLLRLSKSEEAPIEQKRFDGDVWATQRIGRSLRAQFVLDGLELYNARVRVDLDAGDRVDGVYISYRAIAAQPAGRWTLATQDELRALVLLNAAAGEQILVSPPNYLLAAPDRPQQHVVPAYLVRSGRDRVGRFIVPIIDTHGFAPTDEFVEAYGLDLEIMNFSQTGDDPDE